MVTALLALLLGGGSGFIAAAETGDTFWADAHAAAFGTAIPMIGDRGIYTKEHTHRENGTHPNGGEESEFAVFEWIAHTPIWDATGTPRSVVGLRFLEEPVLEDDLYFDSRDVNATWLVDPAAQSAVAVRSEADANGLSQGQQGDDIGSVVHFPPPGWSSTEPLFCGMFHSLQGTVQDIRDGTALFPTCRLDDWGGPPANASFQPEALARIGEATTLVLHAAPAPDTHAERVRGQFYGPFGPFAWEWRPTRVDVRVWLAPENPYPLRIESYDPATGYVEIYRLVAFERGDTPFPDANDLPDPLPPVQQEALQPWGPDDSGIDHPYPLSEAFRNAREDPVYPDLRAFLERHPDAMVTKAEHRLGEDEGRHYRSWSFELWGGRDVLVVCAERQGARSPDPLLDPGGAGADTHQTCREHDTRPLDWAERPERLPTIQSLISVWQASFGTDRAPNSYGFSTFCPTQGGLPVDPCTYRFTISNERTTTVNLSPLGKAQEEQGTQHRLEADGDGHLLRYDNVIWPMPSAQETPARPTDENEPTPFTMEAPVWMLPGAAPMAGTALLATASGLLYWLWPTLKSSVFAPLFTRIRTNRVLDHPVRSELHAAITSTPGVHLQELIRRTGRAEGTVRHHLEKLMTSGLVHAEKTRGFTCYFTSDPQNSTGEQVAALKSPGAQAVLAALVTHPDTTGAAIARATGLTRQTVAYHLDRLSTAGLVSRHSIGNNVVYRPISATWERLRPLA